MGQYATGSIGRGRDDQSTQPELPLRVDADIYEEQLTAPYLLCGRKIHLGE